MTYISSRLRRVVVPALVALVAVSGCSGRPPVNDALITNDCDVTVLAAVLDDSEFNIAVAIADFARLEPGESTVYTRPNFDGDSVYLDVTLASDYDVSAYRETSIGDVAVVRGDDGRQLFDATISGELCPAG